MIDSYLFIVFYHSDLLFTNSASSHHVFNLKKKNVLITFNSFSRWYSTLVLDGILPLASPIPSLILAFCCAFFRSFLEAGIFNFLEKFALSKLKSNLYLVMRYQILFKITAVAQSAYYLQPLCHF